MEITWFYWVSKKKANEIRRKTTGTKVDQRRPKIQSKTPSKSNIGKKGKQGETKANLKKQQNGTGNRR